MASSTNGMRRPVSCTEAEQAGHDNRIVPAQAAVRDADAAAQDSEHLFIQVLGLFNPIGVVPGQANHGRDHRAGIRSAISATSSPRPAGFIRASALEMIRAISVDRQTSTRRGESADSHP